MSPLFQNSADLICTKNLIKLIEDITNQNPIFFLTLLIPNIIPLVSADVVVIGSTGHFRRFAQGMYVIFAMQLLQSIQSFSQGCVDGTGDAFEDGVDFLQLCNTAFQGFDILR